MALAGQATIGKPGPRGAQNRGTRSLALIQGTGLYPAALSSHHKCPHVSAINAVLAVVQHPHVSLRSSLEDECLLRTMSMPALKSSSADLPPWIPSVYQYNVRAAWPGHFRMCACKLGSCAPEVEASGLKDLLLLVVKLFLRQHSAVEQLL